MTVTLNTLADLNLTNARRVAHAGESIAIGETARATMDRTRAAYEAMLEAEPDLFIYGTTTGAGTLAKTRVAPAERRAFAESFRALDPRGHNFGPEALPDGLVRLMIMARLANFISGHGAVRPLVAERVAALLDGPLPRVPLRGMSAPGEILPLFHLYGDLPGEDWMPGEPMSLINGSPCAAATVADVALTARARLDQTVRVFALAVEAIAAPLGHYEKALGRLWNNPHDAAAVYALADALAGVPTEGRREYQAPVTWRVMPRVLGQAFDAVAHLEEVATQSLAAVSANPVYLFPGESDDDGPSGHGRSVSTGGYHNGRAHPAIDAVNAAFAELVTLAGHLASQMHDARATLLPNNLRDDSDGSPAGTNLLAWLMTDYVETARHMAQPTLLPASAFASQGQTDIAEPVFTAWEKHQRIMECMDSGGAIVAAVSVRALDLMRRADPPALAAMGRKLRALLPADGFQRGRAWGGNLDAIRQAFADAARSGDAVAFDG